MMEIFVKFFVSGGTSLLSRYKHIQYLCQLVFGKFPFQQLHEMVENLAVTFHDDFAVARRENGYALEYLRIKYLY
jgi:hypothetical protein